MTKKKTPPPVKKVAPKKKAGGTVTFNYTQDGLIPIVQPPAGETRVSELEAENYALKTLLSKHQSEPMPQTQTQAKKEPVTMLEQFHSVMDAQLERQQNCLLRLAGIAEKLQITKEEAYPLMDTSCLDISNRLSNALGSFARQNEQFEILVERLSKLI